MIRTALRAARSSSACDTIPGSLLISSDTNGSVAVLRSSAGGRARSTSTVGGGAACSGIAITALQFGQTAFFPAIDSGAATAELHDEQTTVIGIGAFQSMRVDTIPLLNINARQP